MTEVYKYHKSHFLLLFLIFILIVQMLHLFDESLADESTCATDCALTDKGWTVHSSNKFTSISQKTLMNFRKDMNDYIHDTEGYLCCPHTKRTLKFVSYDNKATPQVEMYGDLFILTDPKTGQLVELRWYDGQKKHVIYNGECQTCAFNIVPMVKNCLF